MKGYIEVYTGDGKGKTTAAIGLAVRAVGAGKESLFYSVYEVTRLFRAEDPAGTSGPDVITLGKPYFIAKEGMLSEEEIKAWGSALRVYPAGHPPKEYRDMVLKGIEDAVKAVSKDYDLVVLDEYNMAYWYDLATEEDTKRILAARSPNCELVFTGRNAPKIILDAADLITEMKKIRHYYDKGVECRKGIEN